ncbi:helix-turn-helix transcriptional regulator [Xanthobacter autotrophicus]|uniref:helix-turn-helix domain-containing protein n=1 Tax=Xanthobacter autotrophicus TaxID=280 RepID=UPI00372686BD
MQKRAIRRGRPKGTTTFEAKPAKAFGEAVRSIRLEKATAQEALANIAGIERSHMGKIERGEHMPNLALILRIANALECSAAELMAATENNLRQLGPDDMETNMVEPRMISRNA